MLIMFLRRFGHHVVVRAPAKLNLFLEILGKREDGYHELETLMTTAGIFDSIELAPVDSGELSLQVGWATGLAAESTSALAQGRPTVWEPIPAGPENLVCRALERLRERAGVARGAAIRLTKSIPAAAGLGGASSDAAAALIAGNALWSLGWSRKQLAEVASEIGSDVPFFLGEDERPARAAICRGRGERVELVAGLPPLPCVIVRPPVGLSTPAVYRACRPSASPKGVGPLVHSLQRGDWAAVGRALHNGLEPAAASLCPWIGRLRDLMSGWDLVGHQMSGSGTTYFGICRHVRQARSIAGRLRQVGVGAVFQTVTPAV